MSTYHASAVVRRFPFTVAGVFSFVEVREQEQEHHAVQAYPDHKALRVIAFDEQQLELVDENAYELQLCTHKTGMDL